MNEIQIIDPTTYPGWNDLIAGHEEATIFHTSNWAKVLADTYGYKPACFTIFDDGKISAMIPVMDISSWMTGKRGVSLPFSDFCPAIGSSPDSIRKLIQFMRKYGRMKRWNYLELRGSDNGTGYPSDGTLSYYTHSLDLAKSEEEIFRTFSPANRRNIRKAMKENVRVEITHCKNALDEYYRLHCLTRKHHGMPPQPFEFFRKIHDHIISKGLGFISLGSLGERVVSSVIFLHFVRNAIYKFGASDREYLHLRPNNLVMWEAIRHSKVNGFRKVSLGRSDKDQEGLVRYKDGWGAGRSEVRYERYGIVSSKVHDISERNPELQKKLFRLVPLSLTKLIGRIFYRHIG